MTDLATTFERLGLEQYLEQFVEEGFDTWETVLYITESDLDALNVKLGHRRKLQREIASARGISVEQVIGAGTRNASAEDSLQLDSDVKSIASHGEGKSTASGPSKRKYRRHPKPDENAPERPPSAYVLFSNKIREQLRPHKLSFTEIAKTVGERWQELGPEEKEQYESQAAAAKEAYNSELAKYKRTSQYRDYMRYLTDFKARNAPNTAEGKRLKLETEVSNASSNSAASLSLIKEASNPEQHQRKDSLSHSGYSPSNSSMNSPTGSLPRFLSSIESSQGSHPSTPISTHAKHPASSHNTQAQRNYEAVRTQQLPRIMPIEARETSMPHRIPLLNDHRGFSTNPRRSGTNSPTAFLRHDTSKSSTSSNVSGASGGSAAYTPITPAEDRPSRSLPVPPPLLGKAATTGLSSLADLARPPATSAIASNDPGEFGHKTPIHNGYPQSFQHLSIKNDSQEDDGRPKSASAHGAHVANQAHVLSSSTHQLPQGPTHPPLLGRETNAQDQTSRMNSLSVLALAGQLMNHEQHDSKDLTR